MLDYKDIVTKHYALKLSGREIAALCGISKSGVNDFLKAFEECEAIDHPLPEGITNYAIYEIVYGKAPGSNSRDIRYELPDFENIAELMASRQNMTLVYLWNRYKRRCEADGKMYYLYRQFCELYGRWCEEHQGSGRFPAVKAEKMEVDFAGQTFRLIDRITGELATIVVFVAVLPWSNYTYAEGMASTREPQWIEANNNALAFFGGVPAVVVCDNCKQAVLANKDWIEPDLNKDYAEWAEHNRTVILPAKVRKPKWKSHVECAVGILEKGLFHDLEEMRFFTLEQFNDALWDRLGELNVKPFEKKEHTREYYWEEERESLMPLPLSAYRYSDKATAKVSGDYHVRYDNAYYSVDKAYVHKKVEVRATASTVRIISQKGELICEWPRATRKGQWQTDAAHLPENYREFADWSGPYFTRRAMTVGPNTTEAIGRILKSRNLEVQTYRLCQGVLSFAKKHGKQALEECCAQALAVGHVTYTFIKNSIVDVAEAGSGGGYSAAINAERNKGAFVMDASKTDMQTLLAKSESLAAKSPSGEEA
jgi:transposase